jgi:cytochrome oxidase Cu insertion factor (SCO1/SenC/PrrC family)
VQEPNTGNALRRQRLKLLLIFFLFALPLLAAVIWHINIDRWRPVATTNYGELIVPARPLAPFDMLGLDGAHITQDFLRGKWTLVYIGSAECGVVCRGNLYKMRQARLALNEKMDRVQRLWVLSDAPHAAPSPVLLSEHPGLAVAKPDTAELEHFMIQFNHPDDPPAGPDRIYLIDPLGNLMMQYPADADPKGLLRDLQRLMITSWVG